MQQIATDVELQVARTEQFDELVDLLHAHVELEERTLYHCMNGRLPNEAMAKLVARFAVAHSKRVPTFPPGQVECSGYSR
jgi:hypothetical protein